MKNLDIDQTIQFMEAQDKDLVGRFLFSVNAGILVRGYYRREFARADFLIKDLTLDIQESKGFFSSDFTVKGEGPISALLPFVRWLKRAIEEAT